jgi:hypothetical protein
VAIDRNLAKSVGHILEFFAREHVEIELIQHPYGEGLYRSYPIFQTRATLPSGETLFGYHSGDVENSQMISIVEAYERCVHLMAYRRIMSAERPDCFSEFEYQELRRHFFDQKTSSGTASHSDFSEACHGAMREVIERDADFRFWSGSTNYRLSDQEMDPENGGTISDGIDQMVSSKGYRIQTFEVPRSGTYRVVISVIVNSSLEYPFIFLSSGCDQDLRRAILLARAEVFRLFWMNLSCIRDRQKIDVSGPDQAARYYEPGLGTVLWEFLVDCCRSERSAMALPSIDLPTDFQFFRIDRTLGPDLPPVVRAVCRSAKPMFFGPSCVSERPLPGLVFHPFWDRRKFCV